MLQRFTLRDLILAIILVGTVGLIAELLLQEHIGVLAAVDSPGAPWLRTCSHGAGAADGQADAVSECFSVMMVSFLAAGALGVYLHLAGNAGVRSSSERRSSGGWRLSGKHFAAQLRRSHRAPSRSLGCWAWPMFIATPRGTIEVPHWRSDRASCQHIHRLSLSHQGERNEICNDLLHPGFPYADCLQHRIRSNGDTGTAAVDTSSAMAMPADTPARQPEPTAGGMMDPNAASSAELARRFPALRRRSPRR